VFAACLLVLNTSSHVLADSPQTEKLRSIHEDYSERLEKGVKGPLIGYHVYWKDGLNIDSHEENLRVKITGKVMVDGGYIDADDELQSAFPDLGGSNIDFRKLSVSTYALIYDTVDCKIEIDFANVTDIQDIWIRYLKNAFLKRIKIGHQKEPLSLEYLTSRDWISFMERALPVDAFGNGRNIGIRYDSLNPDKWINWGAGFFLNTGSFSTVGEGSDQLSQANGFDLTARAFGVPVYEENGKRMLHLGLGYSYGYREDDNDNSMNFRTRPESRLTDDRLVDTGPIPGKRRDTLNAELAMVYGPLSFQGEGFFVATDAEAEGDPNFWGYYAYVSWFVTGERRAYNKALGVFAEVEPRHQFRPLKGEWGACELALRHSYVDLHDGNVDGGKESNFTAGLNWHHSLKTRVMFNYIHAYVQDRASPPVENGRADIFQVRCQFLL
jgi:phosphate-selective porin OprO/OprP